MTSGQIASQRQAYGLLGGLLEQAARDGLPGIAWTVSDVGATLRGEFYARPPEVRREQYAAWKATLTTIAGEPEHDREHQHHPGAAVRMVTQWEQVPVRPGQRHPSVRVSLAATIWPDDQEEEEW